MHERRAWKVGEQVRETSDGLGRLKSIMLFLGRCPPPCFIQIPRVTPLFPRKGTETMVPKDSGLGHTAKGPRVRLPLVVMVLSVSFFAPDLPLNRKASLAVGGGLSAWHCLI